MIKSKLRTRDPRLIEPRVRTEAKGAREQSSSRLPDAVVSEQVQRLAVCTAVGAGLWTYGLVMDTIIRPLTVGVIVPRTNVTIELAGDRALRADVPVRALRTAPAAARSPTPGCCISC